MKKHVIALAVCGVFVTPALAQTVEIYGVIDQGYTATDTDTTVRATGVKTTVTDRTTGNGGAYTSQRLGFRGTEDLGGGLKAIFNVEYGLVDNDARTTANQGTDNAAPIAARQLNVGLTGNFGSVRIGRMTTLADVAWGVGDVGGGNNFIGRAYTSSTKLNNSRSDKLVEYTTPVFNGFKLAAQYGTGSNENGGVESSHKETGVGLSYSAGPLNVMVGYSNEEDRNAGAYVADGRPKQTVLGANYTISGFGTLFLTHATGSNKDAAGAIVSDKTFSEIGLAYPMGNLTLQFSYFDGDNKATTTTRDDQDGYQIAALYSLSKRTTAYAVMGSSDTTSSTSTNSKVEVKQVGMGIRHTF